MHEFRIVRDHLQMEDHGRLHERVLLSQAWMGGCDSHVWTPRERMR